MPSRLMRHVGALGEAASALTSSISVRLAALVLVIGGLALGLVGALTLIRLDLGLQEQADALNRLSEQQLVHRLDAEAQLARARLESLRQERARRLRQIAQRANVVRALALRNDVTIGETLGEIAKTSDFDALFAYDNEGRIIGTHPAFTLLVTDASVANRPQSSDVLDVLSGNSRSNPRGAENTRELGPELLKALDLPARLTIAHEAIEPVFSAFDRPIGAIAAFRVLAPNESTLENFSSLTNAGVVIMKRGQVVSAAGPPNVRFSRTSAPDVSLIRSDDNNHVARCVDSGDALSVCVFTDSSVITATRDQMFRIGAEQTRSLISQFLAFAAIALITLVFALLIGVRRSTRGLSKLASAAMAVANGNLDVPFRATGVGEVLNLGHAFERMLANLRGSMGRIRQLAFYDTVTGLPNREKMRLDAPQIMSEARAGAFLFMDLDSFKSINDTFGHRTGDALLASVASRLSAFVTTRNKSSGEVFPLARVGGDEFAAILPGVTTLEEASETAAKLIALVREPFEVGGSHMTVGASVGVTLFPADGKTYEELLINADLAMYAAKSKGRNTFAYFTREIAENAKERVEIENDLKLAVQENALEVHYQPQVSCRHGTIRGVEALVRWKHPRLGWVSPNKFIGVAEETGLIAEIGRFVLRTALRDIGRLIAEGMNLVVSVNSSALEIEDALFAKSVKEIVQAAGFPAGHLELEITESMAMHDPTVVCERIAGLRELGVRFAIDDFGTGYSNLATLARLPFDTVKLDRSLISGIATNAEKQSIVRITIDLAKELGFDTVVEGVETYEELRFVADAGATMAQGFLFSPPVTIQELATIVRPGTLVGLGATPFPLVRERRKAAVAS